MDGRRNTSDSQPILAREVYELLLQQTRDTANQIVGRLCALEEHFRGEAPSGRERRASPRLGGAGCVRVSPEDAPGEQEPAWVRDRSAGGLGLLLVRLAAVDSLLDVAFPDGPSVRVRVVHCHPEAVGWRAGCAVLGAAPGLPISQAHSRGPDAATPGPGTG
jgi:hypothetical protein